MSPAPHRSRTLALAAVLHAFTHIYQVALMPLYLPIVADLKLEGEGQATLLVTVMLVAYFGPAYPVGMLADKFSRTTLLGWGLLLNAVAFIALAFAPNYAVALACVAVSGVGGSFFHPSATALVAQLYPVGTGRALGLLGVGASLGFFVGPLFSGWRAETTGSWRAPVLELGVLGVVMAGVFAWVAREVRATGASTKEPPRPVPARMFNTRAAWVLFVGAALAFGLRDFAGHGMASLGSLFLQKAHAFSVKEVGAALGAMYLLSALSNPIFGHFSDRGRIRWTCAVLLASAALIAVYPHLARGGLVPVFLLYGFFLMASYPMVEAALMESVPDSVRGRVFGLFITIGGMVGNTSHALAGRLVENLGPRASDLTAYFSVYAGLSGLMVISLAGLACLHWLRRAEQAARDAGGRGPAVLPSTAGEPSAAS